MGGLIDRPRAIKRAERTNQLTNVTNTFGKPDKYILQSRKIYLNVLWMGGLIYQRHAIKRVAHNCQMCQNTDAQENGQLVNVK